MTMLKTALACALVGAVGSASAVTFTGTNFSLTSGSPVAGEYGAISASGNTVYFKPGGSPGFTAEAAGDVSGPGSQTLSEDKSFSVQAAPGFVITGLWLKAIGTYFYFTGTNASVGVTGSLTVSPSTSALGAPAPAFVGYVSEQYDAKSWVAQTGSIAMSLASPASATVRIQMALAASAFATAADPDFNYAFIDARELQLTVMTTPVPEPETYALLLAGLGVVGFVAARRRPRV